MWNALWRGEGGSFYSPRRSVPARNKYGNIWEPPYEDTIDFPAKAQANWRQHGAGRPRGSAGPRVLPLAPPFVLDTARWALILCMSVPGFCTSVFSLKCAHLVSVTLDAIFCALLLCLVFVFFLFHLWVPANQDSPKLMELVRIKPYN